MNDHDSLFGGSWTEQKLDILRKYLNAYTVALKNKKFECIYIDAFAGTGYCGKGAAQNSELNLDFAELRNETVQEYITGSARIALETEPPFQQYIYIDLDNDKCARLEELKNVYPSKASRISIINEDANSYIQRYVSSTDWRGRRAVMFLDPFGMQVSWNTIR